MVFFPVLYVTILFLPGALLLRGLRIKTVPVFVAALLSLTIMSFALAAVRGAGGRPSTYTVLVFAFLVAAALFVTYRLATRYRRENHPAWRWRVLGRRYGVSVVVALVAALYAAWSGPYLEIPSDSLWHLSLLQDQLQAIEADRGRALHSIGNIFDKQQEYWYWIYAWAAHVSGTSIDGTLHSAWIIHAVVIVLSVYQFALYLFRKRRLDRFLLQAVGAASALFFVLHFGISVFNYVRYYAFAPTILGYTGYLGAVYAFLVYLEKPRGGYKHLAVSILLLVGTFMLHKQETMFAVVMIGLVLALRWFRGFGYGHRWQSSSTSSHVTVVGAGSRTTIWFALFVAVYLSTHAYLYFNGMRNDPLTGGFMFSLENMLPFLKNLYVLIPTFQFYQVITVWGVLVYVLYVVRRSEFRGIDFVHAGMLSPLITVFNPVFTDLFLRLSYPEVLWRLCYLIPLYFVAGYLFVFSVKGLTSAPVRGTFVHGLSVALIVLLLFPINTTFFESPYSRVAMLAPVDRGNDHRQWEDLIEYVSAYPGTRVLTDPVTGYVINAHTEARYGGYKFYGFGALNLLKQSFSEQDFRFYRDGLLIVNLRDGSLSTNGRLGNHWPDDVMHVSRYYGKAMLAFVDQEPRLFRLVWERDRIRVYEIASVTDGRSDA